MIVDTKGIELSIDKDNVKDTIHNNEDTIVHFVHSIHVIGELFLRAHHKLTANQWALFSRNNE